MKKEIIKSEIHFYDAEQEAYIKDLKGRLISTVELQGQQDGAQNKPKTNTEYWSLILLLIQVTIQGVIDSIQQRYQPVSGIGAAKLIEAEANKQEQEIQNKINDDQHKLQKAEDEAKKIRPDVKLMEIRKWVMVALVFISCTEGLNSYNPLRYASLPILGAMLAAIGIACAVGLAAHYSGGFIKAAKTKVQIILRYLICMIPAVIGFSYLGYLRANAYNRASDLHVGTSYEVASHSIHSASAFAIAVISILLYWVAVFISTKFFRTEEERLQENEYEEKCKEVESLQTGIQEQKDNILQIRNDKLTQIALAFKKYEYALAQETNLINFAHEAAEAYKQKNLRHRTDGIPQFFSYKPQFKFTRFFDNVNSQTQKYETVNN